MSERIDFELCRTVGRAARDANGRFAHLLGGERAPPPLAVDEYVGLAVLNTLRGLGWAAPDHHQEDAP